MTFSLPCHARRRYLTGIDWSIGTLDHLCRQSTGVGNVSQIILDLQGTLDPDRLQTTLNDLARLLPILQGRVARDWLNLAPYWRSPRHAEHTLCLQTVPLKADEHLLADRLLHAHVNAPWSHPCEYLRFLLIHLGKEHSRLGMVFDHRLLDAAGAEAFLQLVEEHAGGRTAAILPLIEQTHPAHLDRWAHRFRCGRTINRMRLRLSARPVLAPSMPPRTSRPVLFYHDALSLEETLRVQARAAEESGMPLLLPSALDRAIQAMLPAMPAASQPDQQLLIAVSIDTRPPRQTWEHLLFNHLSFLGFTMPAAAAPARAQRIALLSAQFYEQMKENIPAALQDVTMLTRICPHWLSGWIARRSFRQQGCSFYFACLRESAVVSPEFLGRRILNLRHTPRVPPPPGLGLGLTFFQGRMNIVLSCLEGVLTPAQCGAVLARFRAGLLEESPDLTKGTSMPS